MTASEQAALREHVLYLLGGPVSATAEDEHCQVEAVGGNGSSATRLIVRTRSRAQPQ
jgi:hypothetical protein